MWAAVTVRPRQSAVLPTRVVGRYAQLTRHVGQARQLAGLNRRRNIVLPDLDLAPQGQHNLLVLIAAGGLDVHHPAVRVARRGAETDDAGLDLDRIADMDRHAKTHVLILEVGSGVLGNILDALAEDDVHDQARRGDQAAIAVAGGVAQVFGQRVGGHAELGEGVEQALGERLADLVTKVLPGAKVFQKIAAFLAHRRAQWPITDRNSCRLRVVRCRYMLCFFWLPRVSDG